MPLIFLALSRWELFEAEAHLSFRRVHRLPRIHHHHDSNEGTARAQVGADEIFPLCAQGLRHARVAVAGEIDQPRRFAELVEVDGLGATRPLAGVGEALPVEQRVDRARLADIRAAGKRHFRRSLRRQVRGAARGRKERRLGERFHGCREILIKSGLLHRGPLAMIRLLALGAGFAACCAGPALAQQPPVKPDLARGQSIAAQVCAACHAADGNSTAPANPKIAGQFPEYLNKQLSDFKPKDGKKPARESPVMMGMVANLSEADMKSLAAYYAAQQLRPSAAADKDLVALGQRIWRGGNPAKNIPACSGCHGPAGSGIPAQYPRLAGQYAEYLGAQLKAFREATRANDTNGIMRGVAAHMNDREIRAVSEYAAGLR